MKRIVLVLIFMLSCWAARSQSVSDSSITLNMFSFHVNGFIPGGDIAQRYGMNMGIGGSYMLKLKSNWLLYADFSYFSGNNLKEDEIFDEVRDSEGIFINIYGEVGAVTFYERGFYTGIGAGKIFPIIGPNENSGIMIRGSAGFLQYKTLIHQDGNDIPYLNDEYRKGYDRLSNGFGLSEFIGYVHLGSNDPVNFYAGFEFHQAWTKNRRDWDFYLREPENRSRMDFLFGIRFGWIFPIKRNIVRTYHYY